MDPLTYKLIHLIGVIALLLGAGGMITYSNGSSPIKGLVAAFHGLGLVLILISGFGKFSVKEKMERKGRNPQNGQPMMLAPRKVLTFKCSGKLRDRINGKK